MSHSELATDRQMEFYDRITELAYAGKAVTYDVLAASFSIHKNAVKGHIDALFAKGYLDGEREENPETGKKGKNKANSLRPKNFAASLKNAKNSRIGENFTVNIVNNGMHVVFMFFSETGMIDSGFHRVIDILKIADAKKIDPTLPIIDRIAAIAAKEAAKRVPVVEVV